MPNQIWTIELRKPGSLRQPNLALLKVGNIVQARFSKGPLAKTVAFIKYPVVKSLSPTSGTHTGGTSVTIHGTSFTGATSVLFGATSASFVVNNDTTITATTPAHTAGTVNVIVKVPGGSSSAVTGTTYTFT